MGWAGRRHTRVSSRAAHAPPISPQAIQDLRRAVLIGGSKPQVVVRAQVQASPQLPRRKQRPVEFTQLRKCYGRDQQQRTFYLKITAADVPRNLVLARKQWKVTAVAMAHLLVHLKPHCRASQWKGQRSGCKDEEEMRVGLTCRHQGLSVT